MRREHVLYLPNAGDTSHMRQNQTLVGGPYATVNQTLVGGCGTPLLHRLSVIAVEM